MTAAAAVADIQGGASIGIAGFGVSHRYPSTLITALRDAGPTGLTVYCNGLGQPGFPTGTLLADNHQIARLVTCFSARPGVVSEAEKQIAAGEMELEMIAQGTLVERMRPGGAGIPAFYTPTGYGSAIAEGKDIRYFDGKPSRRDAEGLLLPGKRRMCQNDRHVGEIHRHVVGVHGVGVSEPDSPAAAGPGAGPGLTGMEQRGHPRRLDHLIQRIDRPVVRVERLRAGMELEPLDPVVLDQALRHPHALGAACRIDARERDQHVSVGVRALGDLLVRYRRRIGLVPLDVHHEGHGRHVAFPVVRG
jgi:hypothetical protein